MFNVKQDKYAKIFFECHQINPKLLIDIYSRVVERSITNLFVNKRACVVRMVRACGGAGRVRARSSLELTEGCHA